MSRTQTKDAHCVRASSVPLSEHSEASEMDGEVDDDKLADILNSEIIQYEMLGSLPPTPVKRTVTSRARRSVSPAFSMSSVTSSVIGNLIRVPTPLSPMSVASGTGFRLPKKKTGKKTKPPKRTVKDICRDLNFDMDDVEIEELEKEDEANADQLRVDSILDDLLGLGLGKVKGRQGGGGGKDDQSEKHEKTRMQMGKLHGKKPLEFTGDGRCDILKEDLSTVRNTLERVNALISVLEKTRDKLINDDENLFVTSPPCDEDNNDKLPKKTTTAKK